MSEAGRRPQEAEALIRDLYTEHGRSLLAYTARLTGVDHGFAEDMVPETLLRAWKHADRLTEDVSSVRGWLLTVARNLVTDRLRTKAVRPAEIAERPDRPPSRTAIRSRW